MERGREWTKKLYMLACVWVQARVNVLYVVDSLRRYFLRPDSAYVILWARGCVANNVYRMCHFPHPHPYICQNVAKKNRFHSNPISPPSQRCHTELAFKSKSFLLKATVVKVNVKLEENLSNLKWALENRRQLLWSFLHENDRNACEHINVIQIIFGYI